MWWCPQELGQPLILMRMRSTRASSGPRAMTLSRSTLASPLEEVMPSAQVSEPGHDMTSASW